MLDSLVRIVGGAGGEGMDEAYDDLEKDLYVPKSRMEDVCGWTGLDVWRKER